MADVEVRRSFVERRVEWIEQIRRESDDAISACQGTRFVDGVAPGVIRPECKTQHRNARRIGAQLQGVVTRMAKVGDGRKGGGVFEKPSPRPSDKLARTLAIVVGKLVKPVT